MDDGKIEVRCRYCGQTSDVKKHGTGSGGPPRFRCLACKRTFQLDYCYKACQSGIKEHVIGMAMNNTGIRDTARVLSISINAVMRILKNSHLEI